MTQIVRATLLATLLPVAVLATPAVRAASPRETLMRAAFATHDKAQALALVGDALQQTRVILARNPHDREALLQAALATGYRGQLSRSPGDAKAARAMIEALARGDPRDPEAQVALAGWHLTAVSDLGGFLARTVLGASRDTGLAALDRAIALGADRAFYPAYAALIRARLDPHDPRTALAFAERAVAASAPTATDKALQQRAARLAVPLRAGDGAAAQALAKQLLPFGMAE